MTRPARYAALRAAGDRAMRLAQYRGDRTFFVGKGPWSIGRAGDAFDRAEKLIAASIRVATIAKQELSR